MFKLASDAFSETIKKKVGLDKPGLRVKENPDGSTTIEGYGDHNILKDVYDSATSLDQDPGNHKLHALLGLGGAVAAAGTGIILKKKLGVPTADKPKLNPIKALGSLAVPVGAYYALQNASDRPGRAALGGLASAASLALLAKDAPKSTLTATQRAAQGFATLAPTALATYGVHQLQKADDLQRIEKIKADTGLSDADKDTAIAKITNKEDLLSRYPLLRVAPYSEKLRTKLSSDTENTEEAPKQEVTPKMEKAIYNSYNSKPSTMLKATGLMGAMMYTPDALYAASDTYYKHVAKPNIDIARKSFKDQASLYAKAGYKPVFSDNSVQMYHNPKLKEVLLSHFGPDIAKHVGTDAFSEGTSYNQAFATGFRGQSGMKRYVGLNLKHAPAFKHLSQVVKDHPDTKTYGLTNIGDTSNLGTTAHELGHRLATSTDKFYNATQDFKHKHGLNVSPVQASSFGSLMTGASTLHNDKLGLGVALASTAYNMPQFANEFMASYHGSKLMPSGIKNKLSPFRGLPTYGAMTFAPLATYAVTKKLKDMYKNSYKKYRDQELAKMNQKSQPADDQTKTASILTDDIKEKMHYAPYVSTASSLGAGLATSYAGSKAIEHSIKDDDIAQTSYVLATSDDSPIRKAMQYGAKGASYGSLAASLLGQRSLSKKLSRARLAASVANLAYDAKNMHNYAKNIPEGMGIRAYKPLAGMAIQTVAPDVGSYVGQKATEYYLTH